MALSRATLQIVALLKVIYQERMSLYESTVVKLWYVIGLVYFENKVQRWLERISSRLEGHVQKNLLGGNECEQNMRNKKSYIIYICFVHS